VLEEATNQSRNQQRQQQIKAERSSLTNFNQQTRRHRKKKFPWPQASSQEKQLAHHYWDIMLRVVAGLLRNIAYNLGIPTTLLHSLLMADASQEIGWLMDKLQRNSKAQSKPSRVMLSLGKTQGLKSMSKEEGWNYPVVKILHFKEVSI